MDIYIELHRVAARLALRPKRPTCKYCGKGALDLICETADPNFGVLGVSWQTLQCDNDACRRTAIV